MPTYDYKCLECENIFEVFQKITEEPITKCPKCNGKVKRLISAGAGPIFKGSGFYQTDYKNGSKKPESESKVSDKKNSETSAKPNPDKKSKSKKD
jgi:putative FmdB family regulatory protein